MATAMILNSGREVATYTGGLNENLIDRFVKFAGVSESSRRTYTKSIKQMFKYFQANAITSPTREDLVNWIDELKATKAASTVQLYVTAAKIFFRWLSQEGIFANISDHLKTGIKPSHAHKKDCLDANQCAALVANVETVYKKSLESNDKRKRHDSLKSLRDTAILSLMVTAGLRTIEIVRANVGDIRFERGKPFLYVVGKGHNDADEKILLSEQTHAAINAYLKARGRVQASEPLFVSTSRRNKGARLDVQTISKLCKANLRGINLDSPRLTAHSLRHSAATNLVFAGIELPKVQQVLRHKSISTTMIYADAWSRYNNDGEQFLADMIFGNSKGIDVYGKTAEIRPWINSCGAFFTVTYTEALF